jgi:NADH dehydrogenase FAD-containing subunit
LRVDGRDAVFAVGDATDADPKKLVHPAVSQAEVAARNVGALLADQAPETDYRPARGEMPTVPVGPDDGVSVLPDLVAGGRVTRRLRSADLFSARYRKALNLPRRGGIMPASIPVGARR